MIYIDISRNIFTLFYEFLNSVYLYILIVLTEFSYESSPFRDTLGYGLLIVITVAVIVNLVRTVIIPVLKWLRDVATGRRKAKPEPELKEV